MSGYLTGRALEADLPPSLKLTLVALTDAASADGTAWPSQSTLSRHVGVSEKQVRRNLVKLRELGFVTWAHRYDREGNRTSNVYRINIAALPEPPRKHNRSPVGGYREVEPYNIDPQVTGHAGAVITGHSTPDYRTFEGPLTDIAMSDKPSTRPVKVDPPREGSTTEIPDGIPVKAWETFEQYRREVKGRPLNDFARRTVWARLLELPDESARRAALDAAVVRELKEPVYDAGLPPPGPGGMPRDAAALERWRVAEGLPGAAPGESPGQYRARLARLHMKQSTQPPPPPAEPEINEPAPSKEYLRAQIASVRAAQGGPKP